MKYLKLMVDEDLETGEIGFRIKGTKNTFGMYVGSTGLLVAHDIVEHVNGLSAIGGVGDELMALGAIWRCRGQWGDIVRGKHASMLTPEQHIAGEIPQLYYHYRRGVPYRFSVPRKIKDDGDRETFESILETALYMSRGEWEEEEVWDPDTWEQFSSDTIQFMLRGATLFTRRWENDLLGNSQFWAIHDEVSRVLEREALNVGEIWNLGYGSGQCNMGIEYPF